jgi:uncharacterized membrane protein
MKGEYNMITTLGKIKKFITLFVIGGLAYILVEMLFRGHSHISMFFLGGLCFVLIGQLNEKYTYDMSIISQMVISSIIVTVLEFITGLIVNVWLGLGVWDYSNQPYNLLGQICLLFTNLWFLLSFLAIYLDDWLRYKLFGEEKPHYKLL